MFYWLELIEYINKGKDKLNNQTAKGFCIIMASKQSIQKQLINSQKYCNQLQRKKVIKLCWQDYYSF
jgi:hypothetical protein